MLYIRNSYNTVTCKKLIKRPRKRTFDKYKEEGLHSKEKKELQEKKH